MIAGTFVVWNLLVRIWFPGVILTPFDDQGDLENSWQFRLSIS